MQFWTQIWLNTIERHNYEQWRFLLHADWPYICRLVNRSFWRSIYLPRPTCDNAKRLMFRPDSLTTIYILRRSMLIVISSWEATYKTLDINAYFCGLSFPCDFFICLSFFRLGIFGAKSLIGFFSLKKILKGWFYCLFFRITWI